MYVRQTFDGRIPRSVKVPQNYSGNAFRAQERAVMEGALEEEQIDRSEPQPESTDAQDRTDAVGERARPSSCSPGFRLDVGRLFGRDRGGFGVEELLILGLILLVAGGEKSDEAVFLLLLLLFIE